MIDIQYLVKIVQEQWVKKQPVIFASNQKSRASFRYRKLKKLF